jgi:hypothetical protein
MKINIAQAIQGKIGEEECKIDEEYSGRFMYGQSTAALIVTKGSEHKVIVAAARIGYPHNFRYDEMGRDSVVMY